MAGVRDFLRGVVDVAAMSMAAFFAALVTVPIPPMIVVLGILTVLRGGPVEKSNLDFVWAVIVGSGEGLAAGLTAACVGLWGRRPMTMLWGLLVVFVGLLGGTLGTVIGYRAWPMHLERANNIQGPFWWIHRGTYTGILGAVLFAVITCKLVRTLALEPRNLGRSGYEVRERSS